MTEAITVGHDARNNCRLPADTSAFANQGLAKHTGVMEYFFHPFPCLVDIPGAPVMLLLIPTGFTVNRQ